MTRSRILSETLVCGNCGECTVTQHGTRKVCVCTLHQKRVMSYYPFCDDFFMDDKPITSPLKVPLTDTQERQVLAWLEKESIQNGYKKDRRSSRCSTNPV